MLDADGRACTISFLIEKDGKVCDVDGGQTSSLSGMPMSTYKVVLGWEIGNDGGSTVDCSTVGCSA